MPTCMRLTRRHHCPPPLPARPPTGARAACKADKPDEDPVSGCAKCGPDGAKCLECSEFFGLASNGTCVRCKAPGYYGDRCSKCDGNNPTICLV